MCRSARIKTIVLDAWQAALLAERLRVRLPRVEIRTTVSDPANLDKWATNLKRWFRDRTIKIPNSGPLLEQLEALRAEELRRKDRVRFTTSGEGHDDAAIALCLSAEGLPQRDIGLDKLPPSFRCCWRAASVRQFDPAQCFVLGLGGMFIPPANDVACRECRGLSAIKEARQRFISAGGVPLSLREFRAKHIQGNDFTSRAAANRFAQVMGL